MSRGALDNIFVERDIANWQDLDKCLARWEAALQNPPGGRPVRLLIIDSIAHIFRDAAEFGSGAAGMQVVCHHVQKCQTLAFS